MKRLLIVTMIILLITSVGLSQAKLGGIARQIALGGSNASTSWGAGLVVNPFVMEDPAFSFINPAYIGMYQDYGWFNVAGGSVSGLTTGNNGYTSQHAGINFALNREWTFGAILSYDPSSANALSPNLASFVNGVQPGRSQGTTSPVDVFEAVAAYDMGSMDIGFGFLYGWSNRDSKSSNTTPATSENELSARVLGFRAGVYNDLGNGNALDLSAAIRLDKATDNVKGTTGGNPANGGDYSASATEIQAAGRLKLKASNKFNFIPYAAFLSVSGEPKQDAPPTGGTATTTKQELSFMALAFGVGGEFRTQTIYLAGGVSYQTGQFETKTTVGTPAVTSTSTSKSTSLPVFNMGGEWWFTDWLMGRVGYYRAFVTNQSKFESPTATNESNIFAPNSNVFMGSYGGADNSLVTFGAGMRFGGFALDATVSEELLRRGFGAIGAQDDINTFGYITTSYNFAE